jgi:hypothetical protein
MKALRRTSSLLDKCMQGPEAIQEVLQELQAIDPGEEQRLKAKQKNQKKRQRGQNVADVSERGKSVKQQQLGQEHSDTDGPEPDKEGANGAKGDAGLGGTAAVTAGLDVAQDAVDKTARDAEAMRAAEERLLQLASKLQPRDGESAQRPSAGLRPSPADRLRWRRSQ